MKVHTVGELCGRLRVAPGQVLGSRSPRTINAYLVGYETAIEHRRVGTLVDETGNRFSDWASSRVRMTDEHESRLNARNAFGAESIAMLNSEDEHAHSNHGSSYDRVVSSSSPGR